VDRGAEYIHSGRTPNGGQVKGCAAQAQPMSMGLRVLAVPVDLLDVADSGRHGLSTPTAFVS
jgi:hypothetical protein